MRGKSKRTPLRVVVLLVAIVSAAAGCATPGAGSATPARATSIARSAPASTAGSAAPASSAPANSAPASNASSSTSDTAPATSQPPTGAPPLCPALNEAADASPSSALPNQAPDGVRLCAFAGMGPTRNRPDGGVLLGAGPATVVSTVLSGAASAAQLTAQCGPLPADLLLRFGYPDGTTVDVPVISYGCSQTVAFVDGKLRLVDTFLSQTLDADAGSYLLSGTKTPDLYGTTLAEAAAVATAAGYTLMSDGEQIDPDVPAGTVVLQYPPAGMGSIGAVIEVTIATPHARPCQLADLAIDYYGGGPGMGSDAGTIRLRDVADQPCELAGPAQLIGTDRAGRRVTQSATYPVEPDLVLTARAALVPPTQEPPLGEITAALLVSAEYRDDPTSADGSCVKNQVIPASWRLTLPAGTLTVANASIDSGYPEFSSLLTCRGEIDTPTPIGAG